MTILDGISALILECKKQKKIVPWERKINIDDLYIKKIYKLHNDFFNSIKDKYIQKFPEGELLFNYLTKNEMNNKKSLHDLITDNKTQIEKSIGHKINYKKIQHFWNIIARIKYEFMVCYPNEYVKYTKWCSDFKPILPIKTYQDILLINNFNDLVNYFLNNL